MFTYNGKKLKTWNPFTGCNFNCSYCWARKLAETKLKNSYPNGFIPEFHPERLKVSFKPDDFVFVCSMGDISFIKLEDYDRIDAVIQKFPDTKFLLCTKSPYAYAQFKEFPDNLYLGATIETNRAYPKSISKAPEVLLRYGIMASLEGVKHKFISIEPVMDFDLIEFTSWIYDINPEIVEIGADNYKNNLPEPSSEKVRKLIDILTLHGINVIQKQGLERLCNAVAK
jgi:hypothetical protein